ncbi:2-hydroxychromene-2-carboxylate isomerase [Methylobacterium bullatum]|uniref:2-hydroxychromene-2-carboxylate isomerase n=1 Tax=Methylobacterium bullatum TaxID=570505 RepID=A0A679JRS8_9HYPH|nr:2-hydroxychromene-2-carboxylate isomerase [Methylobacterium bullatum]
MNEDKTIRYYFWTMSDWAYLGHRRLVEMAERHGVTIDYRPIDLPAVYAQTGGMLLNQRSRQRQNYRMAELRRWKARLDDPITIEPRHFPTSYDLSSRILIAAKLSGLPLAEFSFDILRAIWVEERDIGDAATLRDIAARHVSDVDALFAAAGGPKVVAEYARYTREAPDDGVFGSPSYVFNAEPFWGQDRLDFLEEAVAARR